MKRKLLLTLFFTGLIILSGCKNNNIPQREGEPYDPESFDISLWSNIEPGLNFSFGSTNIAYKNDKPPVEEVMNTINLSGWKGERIQTQMLLWGAGDAEVVNINISPKRESNSNPEIEIETSFVKYVIADEFINGCGWRDKDTIVSNICPDILEPGSSIDLHKYETRPVWLAIIIGSDCKPGIYKYNVSANSLRDTLELEFEIEVLDRILPPPSEWQFHLDLWQNPFAVARYHKVQLWSQEHWDLLGPLLSKLASAGQKCITTTLNDKPWGGQTFDPFGSMITWIKDDEGNWSYDYSLFDQYVLFAMEHGISKQINCYSMVPWNNRFTFYDEKSTGFIEVNAKPGTEEYIELWTPFLIDFREHLRDMGWLNISTIAMDERKPDDMKKIIKLVKENAPELKITLAGNILQPEIDTDLYDLSIAIGLDPDKEIVKARVASGKPTTFYTCCARPEHPNNFTFSPPADNTYIGWFAAGWGYSGFLRWAYNSWVENPLYDSRFRTWPSGDTFLVYPGAISSIRFEKLIEGIQDYEKIRILREELSYDPSLEAAIFEEKIDQFLNSLHYSQLKERPSKNYILEGQKLLYDISTRQTPQ